MKWLTWLYERLSWKKSLKSPDTYDFSLLDDLNSKLEYTVLDTSNISRRIIKKLEDRVEQVEGQLSDREKFLEIVFNNTPVFLCLKDGAGRWKLLNSYGRNIYGLEGGIYKEKTNSEIALISPRYAKALEQSQGTDELAWLNREPLKIEERTEDSFGIESIFDVTKIPIYNIDGSRKNLLVVGKNITEELNDTKHIRMLADALDYASDSICITDYKYNIIYANKSFCNTHEFKYSSDFDVKLGFIKSDLIKETITKGITWTGIINSELPSGKTIAEDVTITPILNGKPYPIYYIGVKRLVDRRKTQRK